MVISNPIACGKCGCPDWRLECIGNDEPDDRKADWMNTARVFCRQCGTAILSISNWYDGTFEVALLGKPIVQRQPGYVSVPHSSGLVARQPDSVSSPQAESGSLVCCVCGGAIRDAETHRMTPSGPAHLVCPS